LRYQFTFSSWINVVILGVALGDEGEKKKKGNPCRTSNDADHKQPQVVGLRSQEEREQRQCRYDMKRKTAHIRTGLEKSPKLIGIAMPQL
jgi:hypothetical protein